ncbi:MAG: acetoacetate--CoA ligase [Burkholderiaceae bacterium]|nr:MAG: acetoacetate--CoA ligase [Burkholderiaceae bacterium]
MPVPEPQITRYQRWLRETRGLQFATYDALWQWSVTDLEAFWSSIWQFFDIESPTPHARVLADERMPGARWFEGAQVNYARQALRHADALHAAGHPAIVFADEPLLAQGRVESLSWPDLRRQVAACALALRRLGVTRGDRVCAYLPNRPETAVVFLACASLGAIWSLCSPDMGPVAVLDRFRQIEPRVLFACDGYRWAGAAHDRRGVVRELVEQLPSVSHLVLQPLLGGAAADAVDPGGALPGRCALHSLPQWLRQRDAAFEPEWLPFDHPLWVVYSSGTTGLPKAIVHGHGGVMIEGLKLNTLHNDIGPTLASGERYHWYSSTGWIMWNCQVAGLLGGTTICLFDGSPAGASKAPDWTTLWRFAALSKATFFGAGAAFYASCLKAGVSPKDVADLSALRALGSTGSPLANECYRWAWAHCPKVDGRDIWLTAISGGTDFAGAFIAGLPTLPMVEGEMQCRCLGAAVEAWSEPDADGRGRSLIDEVGELVCTRPLPSMPLRLWGDADEADPLGADGAVPPRGSSPASGRPVVGRRLHESYFDMYPGVWRHGDWIRIVPHPESGASGAIIYGRSDATINRHGVRMGTSELYRAVEALPEVLDSLVVDLEYLGRESWMPLFVVLREGHALDDALAARIKAAVRAALSPRHVPNDVFQVAAIPRTLSGKKMELPVKKLLMGADPASVLKRDAMANADSVDWFVALARARATKS